MSKPRYRELAQNRTLVLRVLKPWALGKMNEED
jgi:hypothetical protein